MNSKQPEPTHYVRYVDKEKQEQLVECTSFEWAQAIALQFMASGYEEVIIIPNEK